MGEYKRLGDYIREVNVRNRDLKVTNLLGVNLSKQFFPSIANIIGTDLSKYKIIEKGQFGCKFMSVGRDGILPISLKMDDVPAIISSAYCVFEVENKDILLPEYLMMWLCRPEFDRQLSFYAGGDVRGGVNYEDFCEMPIIIPSIERQREIVAEYEILTRRIRLNEQIIQNLETTAQTLYRKMFVDGIDKENLPEGWRMGTLGEVVNCFDYKRKPLSEDERKNIKGIYPYYGAMSVVDYVNKYIFDGTYLLFSEDGANVIDEFGHPALQYLWGKFWVNNHAHVLQGNDIVSTEYLYMALKDVNVSHLVTGAAQPKINQENMNSILLVVPSKKEMENYNKKVNTIFDYYKLLVEENKKLTELQSLLLAKMGQ